MCYLKNINKTQCTSPADTAKNSSILTSKVRKFEFLEAGRTMPWSWLKVVNQAFRDTKVLYILNVV